MRCAPEAMDSRTMRSKAGAGEDADERQREVGQQVAHAAHGGRVLAHDRVHALPGQPLRVQRRHKRALRAQQRQRYVSLSKREDLRGCRVGRDRVHALPGQPLRVQRRQDALCARSSVTSTSPLGNVV